MASTPKRRLRDPNDIFASIDKPSSPTKREPSSPTKRAVPSPITPAARVDHDADTHDGSPIASPTKATPPVQQQQPVRRKTSRAYTKPQITTSRRVISISKRFMGGPGSLLRRTGSPPRGRRSPPPRRGSVRKGAGGGIKPPLDLGPQHSNFDTINVRERVRKWQAAGGGVVDPENNNVNPFTPAAPPPPRSASKSPEKRRTMLADYISNENNFDELETSSARWGMEPLALPAPPALMGGGYGYSSAPGSRRGSVVGSIVSHGEGGWEDAASGAEMSGREDKSAWNSAAEDKGMNPIGTKKKKKRVPRQGMGVEEIRARKERRKQRIPTNASRGAESGRETEGEKSVKGDDEPAERAVIPGSYLDAAEDTVVVPMADIDNAPPTLPLHFRSTPVSPIAALSLNSKQSVKSLDETPYSLKSRKSVKSLGDTPGSIVSDPTHDETPASSLLDDDGIRVTALRRKFTKAEKQERHRQRQAEREEMMEREKARIREEERLRYQEIDRIREEERKKEIDRIMEEERQKVLEEEREREEERRKIRELDLKMQREREEQKKRDREREERKRQRELIRQQERDRQIERIKEEEKLKVIEEIRLEQERERLELQKEREKLELERERARLEEIRLQEREEARHHEIMWEIEQATQRSTTRAKKKRKDKETVVAEEVEKRVGPEALRSKEEMTSAIKDAVREVMSEMFGEIIVEDESRSRFSNERSNPSSSIPTDFTNSEAEEHESRTRETTPELEKKSPAGPPRNDITFRVAQFQGPEPERDPSLVEELPRSPEPKLASEPTSPASPETPTKEKEKTSIFSLPKRRIGLFGSPSKRRRKPFQSTIPEESASQLSTGDEEQTSPVGHRVFSFLPRTAAEPISPPVTRQVSAASRAAGPVSPPMRQFSIASRSSQHTDHSDHSTSTTTSVPIHRNLPSDDILDLPGNNLTSRLSRSLTSPASHTNLARDDPGDEYFVSVHEPLRGSGIKRYKSTADLISILSERGPSSARAKSIKSTRSVRTRSIRSVKNKVVVGTLTLNDLLAELATEELSYTQDLILLEHRIVPVLMDAKLAKTDKEAARGKRASPEKLMANNPLKAIVDLNVALKRLNANHEKLSDAIQASHIPSHDDQTPAQANPEAILNWVKSARYVYEDYIGCWKMDWDEVVINVDVLESIEKSKSATGGGSITADGLSASLLGGTAINGNSIDVGYLLKRPLVRTRVLTKLFKRINYLAPSPNAEEAFVAFQGLVGIARHKVAEERARLEDEAAACIDASRVRDLQTLEICYGVVIEPNRRVRARDIFDMKLQHSLGRTLTKRVELYLRDEGKRTMKSENAELMICELAKGDEEKKWLAFQPLPVRWISAKQGVDEGDMILDVNARLSDGSEWQESMVLSTDPMIKMEWLHLLGAAADEVNKASRIQLEGLPTLPPLVEEEPDKPILTEIDTQLKELGFEDQYSEPPTPGMSVVSGMDRFPEELHSVEDEGTKPGKPTVAVVVIPGLSDLYDGGPLAVPVYGELPHICGMMPHYVSRGRIPTPPPSTISPMSSASYGPARLQRRKTRHEQRRMAEVKKRDGELRKEGDIEKEKSGVLNKKQISSAPLVSSPLAQKEVVTDDEVEEAETPKSRRKSPFRLRSQSPKGSMKPASLSFKIVPSPPGTPRDKEEFEKTADPLSPEEASILSWNDEDLVYGQQKGGYGLARRNRSDSGSSSESSSILSGSTRSSATRRSGDPVKGGSNRSGHSRQSSIEERSESDEDTPPPLPLHSSSSQDDLRSVSSTSSGSTVRNKSTVSSRHSATSSQRPSGLKRRISSPLKHEYAPSSATGSDASLSESESESSSSDTDEEVEEERSDDELSEAPPQKIEDEDGDIPGPMFEDMIAGRNMHSSGRKDGTQFEEIPPRESQQPAKHSAKNSISGYTTFALAFSWSAKGSWEKMSEHEAKITLVQNFIEVYKSDPDAEKGQGKQMLSIEVTPVTPIRRGTAVDLSIRAGPYAKFQGGTVMFRTKTPQECEALYNAINMARIDACNRNGFGNSSRPGRKQSIGRSGSVRGYRATNVDAPNGGLGSGLPGEAPSIIMSESSSLGSLGSAFSAFKGSLRSSIFGGTKSSSGSWMSSSSTSSGMAGPRGIINPLGGIPITGIGGEAPYQGTGYVSNLKIKLWKKEGASRGGKWADLGPGRLSIITPPPWLAARGGGGLSAGEKRIVIRDKKGQNTVLDVVLGQSCFERVARTGIGIRVPIEDDGVVPDLVLAGTQGRQNIFMLQFKGESEARETFKIVGHALY